MIGSGLIHRETGHGGIVDDETEDPAGHRLVRINDMWFFLDDCDEWNPR